MAENSKNEFAKSVRLRKDAAMLLMRFRHFCVFLCPNQLLEPFGILLLFLGLHPKRKSFIHGFFSFCFLVGKPPLLDIIGAIGCSWQPPSADDAV